MLNVESENGDFLQDLLELSNDAGDAALDFKSSLDRTVLGEDSSKLVLALAELDRSVVGIKALLAERQGTTTQYIDALLQLEICKQD